MNKIDYRCEVKFNDDGITAVITGEEVEFKKDTPQSVIRPRHVRLTTAVLDLLRDHMKGTS